MVKSKKSGKFHMVKTAYVAMSANLAYPDHLSIIKTARELADVIVGLLTVPVPSSAVSDG